MYSPTPPPTPVRCRTPMTAASAVGSDRGGDGGQFGQQWLHAAVLDRVGVQEAGVEVADALLVGTGRGGGRRRLHDQLADLFLGPVVERAEGPVGGPVARHLILGQPPAVDVAEQIVLRANRGFDVGEVNSRAQRFYRHPTILTTGPWRRGSCPVASPACPKRSRRGNPTTRRPAGVLRLRHRLRGAGRRCGGIAGAHRDDVVVAPRGRRRARIPEPCPAVRRPSGPAC